LYAWHTRASTRVASTGIQPTACVASHTVRAPTRAAAATIASISATSPEADCTSENATRAVSGEIASASCARSGAHADATAGMHERQHERRELVFGDEHLRARVDPGGEKGDLHRRLRPDRDPIG
jgi:hypothetical protein